MLMGIDTVVNMWHIYILFIVILACKTLMINVSNYLSVRSEGSNKLLIIDHSWSVPVKQVGNLLHLKLTGREFWSQTNSNNYNM